LAGALSRTGRYANRLVAFCDPEEDTSSYCVPDADLSILPWRPWELLSGSLRRRLHELVASSDIIQIHGIWEPQCMAVGRLASTAGVPYLVSAHGMLDPWAVRNKRWKKWFYSLLIERPNLNRAACLRALTQSEIGDYRAFGLTPPATVIPNGISIPQTAPDAFFEQYPGLRGRDLVLFLSRIHRKKGIHMLCRVWASVQPSFPDAHLVLAGPDYEDTLRSVRQLVSELNLECSVTFTGLLDYRGKWSALCAASMFVLPSYSEGFSTAILEAMAAGLPVIATHQCHFPELAPVGCGELIEPEPVELERALRRLLTASPAERREIGARGRSLVEREYSWAQIGEKMADVYDWVLGGPKPACVLDGDASPCDPTTR
jgi:glycosyltransferase involved in cell wall biosynthesis